MSDAIKKMLVSICVGGCDVSSSTEEVSRREDVGISLWQSLNRTDISKTRFFVVAHSAAKAMFEVNFLSRHEIVQSVTVDMLPEGWREWGVQRGRNILVHDQSLFRKSLHVADVFLALPKYRFEMFADDVAAVVDGTGMSAGEAVRDVLMNETIGYSFLMYVDISDASDNKLDNPLPNVILCMAYTTLERVVYENGNLCGFTSEQLKLRPDRQGRVLL